MTMLVEAMQKVGLRWQDMRSAARNNSQCSIAVEHLAGMLMAEKRPETVEAVTKEDVVQCVEDWRQLGLSSGTIQVRLNCLSAMGVNVSGCRPKKDRALKWWLTDADRLRITSILRETKLANEMVLADLIDWTCETGLRIEESLRLATSHVHWDRGLCYVPGTKNERAQRTIVLSKSAMRVAHHRGDIVASSRNVSMLFPLYYWQAQSLWAQYRKHLNMVDPSKATLKGLRRVAARNLHCIKGMPLAMLQTYLGHGDVQTTMGYLRLTGGYSEEEQAKWVR